MSAVGDGAKAASRTAILFCSSDKTFDVGVQVVAAFDRQWPDCPFPRFALTTTARRPWPTPGWTHIVAGQALGWRDELRLGLLALPAEVHHVLLILDDFLLSAPVDIARVVDLVGEAERRNLAYLRLKPVDRSVAGGLIWRLRSGLGIAALTPSEPYYASLQIALWRRDHLLAMLSQPGSIWDFENQRLPLAMHYAVTSRGPIRYDHVVEKGHWMPYAAKLFARAGLPFDPGARPVWDRRFMVLHAIRKLRFAVFGYSLMRLRSLLKSGR